MKESDPELHEASNRTYQRILASLPAEVAQRYGYVEPKTESLEAQLLKAMAAKDWKLVAELSAHMAREQPQTG